MRWAVALVLLAVLAGCGGDDDPLTVYAASSLTDVFEELDRDARFNFAGSDELATQIREGGGADVYAAASPRYPDELAAEGLVEEPRVFATNRLVLVVPSTNPRGITSVQDLVAGNPKLVIGAEGVPIGDYTRDVLERMNLTSLLDDVVSEEENTRGVLGKVALGEADAGFVYATDATAAGRMITSIPIPADVQADVRYPVTIVTDSDHKDEAQQFVDLLFSEKGRRALERAGFGLP